MFGWKLSVSLVRVYNIPPSQILFNNRYFILTATYYYYNYKHYSDFPIYNSINIYLFNNPISICLILILMTSNTWHQLLWTSNSTLNINTMLHFNARIERIPKPEFRLLIQCYNSGYITSTWYFYLIIPLLNSTSI